MLCASDLFGKTDYIPAVLSKNGMYFAVLKPGDTVQVLARRYGVAESSLLAANGLVAGAQLAPGQNIVIPAYGQQSAAVAAPAAAAGTAPGQQILGQLPPTKPPMRSGVAAASSSMPTPTCIGRPCSPACR